MYKIFIVEDDQVIAAAMAEHLKCHAATGTKEYAYHKNI